jgi:hypothetical protein
MHTKFWDLINSVILARALYTATSLKLADHLDNRNLSLQELATLTHTNTQSLERLMRFLLASDIFEKQSDGSYRNNASSVFMQKNHPQTMYPFFLHDDETRWNSFGHLTYSIETGKPSFDMLYGKNYFDYLATSPLLSKRFDDAMTIISENEETLIAKTLSFTRSIADIGGGKGTLLKKIIAQQPAVTHTTLFDLPHMLTTLFSDTSISTIHSGNFFEPFTITANTFILKRILHD